MKKICIILFLSFPLALQASGLVYQSEAAATKPLLNQKPQLVYNSPHDILTPKMRSGQYLRTGIVKRKTTGNNKAYAFGEFIDKATRARSIVIEDGEYTDQTEQARPMFFTIEELEKNQKGNQNHVYKVIKGCTKEHIGYIKTQNGAIALYPFNPIEANLDAASKQLREQMLEWAAGENENK